MRRSEPSHRDKPCAAEPTEPSSKGRAQHDAAPNAAARPPAASSSAPVSRVGARSGAAILVLSVILAVLPIEIHPHAKPYSGYRLKPVREGEARWLEARSFISASYRVRRAAMSRPSTITSASACFHGRRAAPRDIGSTTPPTFAAWPLSGALANSALPSMRFAVADHVARIGRRHRAPPGRCAVRR
jgi:hypothetical protein